MRRFLLPLAILGVGAALSAMAYRANVEAVAREVLAARPAGELPLLLRLNGTPYLGGVAAAFADGGVTADIDAGTGQVVKVVCTDAITRQSAGVVANTLNSDYVPLQEARYYVLDEQTQWLSVRNIDAGAATCPWWIMR